MPEFITFEIPGEPVAQGRPRFSTHGGFAKAYDPAKSRSYKAIVRDYAERAMAGQKPIVGPVELTIWAWFTMAKSQWRKRVPREAEPRIKKPDIDNVVKCAKDAMTGVVWLDDSQVVELHANKWTAAQGDGPRLIVTVREYAP